MKQIREVLRLHLLANLSARKIQGVTWVARTTVQEYIKRCNESDISSYEMLTSFNDEILNQKLFGITSTIVALNPSKIMPDYNSIHQEMKRKKKTKVTLMFLWEEYKNIVECKYYNDEYVISAEYVQRN